MATVCMCRMSTRPYLHTFSMSKEMVMRLVLFTGFHLITNQTNEKNFKLFSMAATSFDHYRLSLAGPKRNEREREKKRWKQISF